MFAPFLALLRRDLLLAFRHRGELANPLLFFALVVTLFPLTALDTHGIGLVQTILDDHAGRGGMAVITSHQPVTLRRTLRQLSLG